MLLILTSILVVDFNAFFISYEFLRSDVEFHNACVKKL